MKIYAVTYEVKDIGCFYDVIQYFSTDKEKCEKFIKDNELKRNVIKELESETGLKCSRVIRW